MKQVNKNPQSVDIGEKMSSNHNEDELREKLLNLKCKIKYGGIYHDIVERLDEYQVDAIMQLIRNYGVECKIKVLNKVLSPTNIEWTHHNVEHELLKLQDSLVTNPTKEKIGE